jgi:cobalt-zinc-cadmium efflux system membrane fusion protein
MPSQDQNSQSASSPASPAPDRSPPVSLARNASVLAAAARAVPTLVVLALLGGVGYWGHVNEWRAPKFASLFGSPPPIEPEDWCDEHAVPESTCVKCHPELLGASAVDWCKEHGVPESRCTACHPDILTRGVAGDWCKEHGVPESNCTLCHPEIAVRGAPPASPLGATVVSIEGPPPEEIPAPIKNPATCQIHALRVQFASVEAMRKVGLEFAGVTERPFATTVSANAETTYDRTHLAQVASRVPGVAWRVEREIGESVSKGEVLAIIDSAEVGDAKAELLQAAAQLEVRRKALGRVERLLPQGITTLADEQAAAAAVREAEIRLFNARQALVNLGLDVPADFSAATDERALQFLGLPEALRRSLDPASASANLVPILSPLDGVVLAREVVAGEMVDSSRPLFTVADTRRLWLMIDVPQTQMGLLALGQPVRFRPQGRDDAASGRVSWISTAVDERTRTVRLRAELDNADGRLLSGMFGRAEITVRSSPEAIAVSSEAIQWEGCCHVVFVRVGEAIFAPRKVRLGATDRLHREVLAGLSPGEVVVTAGSHVLKSELLKSNLGAGCCGQE